MSYFEQTVAYLIQSDPFSEKRKQSGGLVQQISRFTEDEDNKEEEHTISSTECMKLNQGKIGIEFSYYKPDKYQKVKQGSER